MRRTLLPVAFALLLTSGFLALPVDDDSWGPFGVASGQAPLPEPLNNTTLPVDPGNLTAPVPDPSASGPEDPYHENIIVVATARNSYVALKEGGSATFEIDVVDHSLPGAAVSRPSAIKVSCDVVNSTDDGGGDWILQESSSAKVRRNGDDTVVMTMTARLRASPEFYRAEVACTSGQPIPDREVGRFNLTARVLPYTYMILTPQGGPDSARPDELIEYRLNLQNKGLHRNTFYGSMDLPPGWRGTLPEQVVLEPGEDRDLTITVWTPRDKFLYLSESSLFTVAYYPEGEEGKAQQQPFSLQVSGVYLHPALIPLTLLTATLIAVLIFFGILARRAVEERILGKPVPPWRIPVEREYLADLMRDDPDQFYIVRHYLMVEEHQSALLWFEAFKAATKKDRKRESKWFKVKRKQERKVIRLEKAHNKVVAGAEKDTDKPMRKAERKKRRLERKLRRKERKSQRKINRTHKKRAKTLVKKHEKKVKKTAKKFEKRRDKELRKVEKANKKREKKGEEPLPLPDLEPPTFEEPEAGEPETVPELPLMESRYAKRAERIDARAARKKERLHAKAQKLVAKDRRRVDAKSERLRAKIPPEPETALYSEDDYVPEDEIIVEDDRSALAKWLFLPTLEERDRARRRHQVHRAELHKAVDAGDEAAAERLKEEYAAERKERAARRKERVRGALAQRNEDRRLAAERKRDLKERTRRIAREEAPPSAQDDVDRETVPLPVRQDKTKSPSDDAPAKGFKLRKRTRASAEDEAATEESAPSTPDES